MKNKKQNNSNAEDESSSQRDSGIHETNDVDQGNTSGIQISAADRENGNLKKFSIAKKTIKKLKARQIEFLYPVQAKSYSTIYEQKDCVIQAGSGVGKTLAFALPIVELLQGDDSTELEEGRAPRVLVIAPTREILKTISDEFESLVNGLTVVGIFTSKKKSDDQETAISNGCDILIATPDRLREFLDQSKVDVSQLKHVVLDEIDRMLDASVLEDLKKILKNVFSSDTKGQLIVFSESYPDSVRKLTKKYLADDHATISVTQNNKDADDDEEQDDDEDEENEDDEKEETTNGSSAKSSGKVSLLTKKENYTTYMLSVNDELKGVGLVYTMLRKCFGDDFDGKAVIPQVAFSKDFKSAVFELPSDLDEQLQGYWKDSARIQMGPVDTLPDIDQDSIVDNSGYTPRNGGGGNGYGFNKSGRGGAGAGGNRNSGRSNACFKCQKEGHKSFECPEGGQGGGNKSAGGCFNCGKDGHKSFECSEPRKAGGRGGGGAGGERSNACFNCGQDGHKSFECPEPKKSRP